MSSLEKEEEYKIKTWCGENDVLFIKFTPMGEVGWPDRVAIFPHQGVHVWTELKRKGEIPKKIQQYRILKLEEQGALVLWFDSAEDCIEIYKEILRDCISEHRTKKY